MKKWMQLGVKDRIALMREYRSNGMSYKQAVNDFETSKPKYGNGGKLNPFDPYSSFKQSLPDNLRNASNEEYDMRYYWEQNGRPGSFDQVKDKDFQFDYNDGRYHGNSVEPNTLRFLKPKTHPTVHKELDWYNSPEGAEFKSKHDIDTTGQYYKYMPKFQDGGARNPERHVAAQEILLRPQ